MSITENAASAPTASSYPGLFPQPISAGLARRLAEAATGYADEGEVYVTARYTPNYDSEDPYAVQAWQHWQDVPNPLEPGYGVFGPFQTTFPSPRTQATVQAFQVTLSDSTTPTSAVTAAATSPMDIPAQNYDALFYSAAAVKKFAVPYYASLYSGAYGDHVLESFQEAPVALMAHMPWSEYTMVEFTAGGTDVPVYPTTAEPAAGSGGEIAVLFVRDDEGNLHPRPLHPHAGQLRGGATLQGTQTPRNTGSRAT